MAQAEYLMDKVRKRLLDLIVVMRFALKYWSYLNDKENLFRLFLEELANIVTPSVEWKAFAKMDGFRGDDEDTGKSNSD